MCTKHAEKGIVEFNFANYEYDVRCDLDTNLEHLSIEVLTILIANYEVSLMNKF